MKNYWFMRKSTPTNPGTGWIAAKGKNITEAYRNFVDWGKTDDGELGYTILDTDTILVEGWGWKIPANSPKPLNVVIK